MMTPMMKIMTMKITKMKITTVKSTTVKIKTMKITTMKNNFVEKNDKPCSETDDGRNGKENGGDVECNLETIY